jgi:hypothetical protein
MRTPLRRFPNHGRPSRIVFTASKGLPGLGFTRAEWNAIKTMQSGTVTRQITDTTLPTDPIERTLEYTAPFTLQNRETASYKTDPKAQPCHQTQREEAGGKYHALIGLRCACFRQ